MERKQREAYARRCEESARVVQRLWRGKVCRDLAHAAKLARWKYQQARVPTQCD